MQKKRLKKARKIAAALLAVIVIGACYTGFNRLHTFTLSGDGKIKDDQVQPVLGSVKVTGTADTNVVFTDIESGKTYEIGYITPGTTGSVKLERGKWYKVEGAGKLTVRPVNLRIEIE